VHEFVASLVPSLTVTEPVGVPAFVGSVTLTE
jgi:hypothetical protein